MDAAAMHDNALSTWQLRFGRAHATQQPRASGDSPQPETSVADHLLQALQKRHHENPSDRQVSRACAEELLGRTNAFVPGMNAIANTVTMAGDANNAFAADAKQILRARFQIEEQAKMMRESQRDKKSNNARHGSGATNATAKSQISTRLQELRAKQEARQQEIAAIAEEQRKQSEVHKRAARDLTQQVRQIREQQRLKRATTRSHQPSSSKSTSGTTYRLDPLAQMEARQRKIQNMKKARLAGYSPRSPTEASNQSTNNNSNDDAVEPVHDREHRRLRDKIQQLEAENQQAELLEEKLRNRHVKLELLRRCWRRWTTLAVARRQQMQHVLQVWRWNRMQQVWAEWLRVVRRSQGERAVEQERNRRLRDKEQMQMALTFHRRQQLPRWFASWVCFVQGERERKEAERAAERRKEQAQRLMERLITRSVAGDRSDTADDIRNLPSEAVPQRPPAPRLLRTAWARNNNKVDSGVGPGTTNSQSTPKDGDHEPDASSSAAAPSPSNSQQSSRSIKTKRYAPDPRYVAMQARAAERQERRQKLKEKYEQQDAERTELAAKQIAEREALLAHHRLEEQQRRKQMKIEARMREAEKLRRLERAVHQRYRAESHDRLRLLYYYAFRPLQQNRKIALRIARNAMSWYHMRLVHQFWLQWVTIHDATQRSKQATEHKKHQRAAMHHNEALQRRYVLRWRQLHAQFQQLATAVSRQRDWSSRRRGWIQWRQAIVLRQRDEEKQLRHVQQRLARLYLARYLQQWHCNVQEAKRERLYSAEKEQLWSKVRTWLNE